MNPLSTRRLLAALEALSAPPSARLARVLEALGLGLTDAFLLSWPGDAPGRVLASTRNAPRAPRLSPATLDRAHAGEIVALSPAILTDAMPSPPPGVGLLTAVRGASDRMFLFFCPEDGAVAARQERLSELWSLWSQLASGMPDTGGFELSPHDDDTSAGPLSEELLLSRANLTALIESSEDMFWSVDNDLRLVAFNQAFAQNYSAAYDVSCSIGQSALELLPVSQRRHWLQLYRYALSGQRFSAEDSLPTRGDGVSTVFEMSLNPIVTDGQVTGVAVHSRDVTERHAAAEAMRAARDAAESANRAKSDFLANMSHEIRTPLNAIIGMSDLALTTELSAIQREYLTTIQSNSESLLNLINDILDFSKIEAGQMGLEITAFRLRDLIEEAALGLGERAAVKGLDLSCFVSPKVPSRVLSDPRHLRQILTNLVSNAIKYTQEGEVVLTVTLDDDSPPDRAKLTITVRDTGVGISHADRGMVFQKFYQARSEHSFRARGTGLGLSITKSLVELLGGTVELESALGVGSEFKVHLTLPIEEREGPHAGVWRRVLTGRRVLIISPSAQERALLDETLSAFGAIPMPCESGVEALSALEALTEAPDGLIIDWRVLQLPELLRRVSLLPNAARCRAIALVPMGRPPADLQKLPGLSARLARPVRRQHIFEALASLRGEAVEQGLDIDLGAAQAPPPAPKKMRILVVEDNPDNQAVVTAALEQRGHSVRIANDGIEALEMAPDGGYDLILMDVHMPRLDGVEATRRLRALEEELGLTRTPIAMLTAHATQDFRERCLEAGADEFLTKPIPPSRLIRAVERFVEQGPVVLVVDDDASNRELLGHYLRAEPSLRVLFARHGREALDIAQSTPVHLVLLDMEMPVLDGHDTAIALRGLPGGERVPILAVTGHAGDDARRRSVEAGCTEHLVKPLRRQELLDAVRRLLSLPGGPLSAPPTESRPAVAAAPAEGVWVQVESRYQDELPAFLRQCRGSLPVMRAALSERRFPDLATLAQSLHDRAERYGMQDLARQVRDVQRAAIRNDDERARRAIRAMLELIEELRIEWV
ncbi:response regulator [Myxococcota bacterium]|nr:response regulator [Myxococcota bacterium]